MTRATGARDPLTCDLQARDLMTPNVMKVPGDVSVAQSQYEAHRTSDLTGLAMEELDA